MIKKLFFLCSMCIVLITGCGGKLQNKNDNKRNVIKQSDDTVTVFDNNSNTSSPKKREILAYVEVRTWIDDFRNLRSAIYNDDIAKLETYFNFPFDDKGKSILGLCNLSKEDWDLRYTSLRNPDIFYESDLQKYHELIFDEKFTKCILKIKSEELFTKHIDQTIMFETTDIVYQMVAEFFPEDNLLRLNMAFGNNFKDDDGNLVSEGEHNVIYSFKVIDRKKLKLERIDVAG